MYCNLLIMCCSAYSIYIVQCIMVFRNMFVTLAIPIDTGSVANHNCTHVLVMLAVMP